MGKTASAPPLLHLDLEITKRCNLSCIHCSASASPDPPFEGPSADQLLSIVRQASGMGVQRIGLTGGEPFMVPDTFEKVLSYCRRTAGIAVHVHSNGTLLNAASKGLRGLLRELESISISFLAGTAELHDLLTGSEGSFGAAMAGVDKLLTWGCNLTCYVVPLHGRWHELPDLCAQLYRIGVPRIRPLALAPGGRAMHRYNDLVLEREEAAALESELLRLAKERGGSLSAGFCTRLIMPNLPPLHRHEACMSGVDRCHVAADGELYPCTAASGVPSLSAGNVLKDRRSLADVWENGETLVALREFRRSPPGNCASCSYYARCGAGCRVSMHYRSGTIGATPCSLHPQAAPGAL